RDQRAEAAESTGASARTGAAATADAEEAPDLRKPRRHAAARAGRGRRSVRAIAASATAPSRDAWRLAEIDRRRWHVPAGDARPVDEPVGTRIPEQFPRVEAVEAVLVRPHCRHHPPPPRFSPLAAKLPSCVIHDGTPNCCAIEGMTRCNPFVRFSVPLPPACNRPGISCVNIASRLVAPDAVAAPPNPPSSG